jgi:membrane protein DedA with SNARE-associated domain
MRHFVPYIALAAILWAGYAVLLGYLGGTTFRNQPIYALVLAFGIAGLVTVGIEAYRRIRARTSRT